MRQHTDFAQLVNQSSVKVFRNAEYREVLLSAGACVEYKPLYDRLTQSYLLRVYVNGKLLGWHWAERFGVVQFACRTEAACNAAFFTEQVMQASAGGQSAVPGPLTRQTPDARRRPLGQRRPGDNAGRSWLPMKCRYQHFGRSVWMAGLWTCKELVMDNQEESIGSLFLVISSGRLAPGLALWAIGVGRRRPGGLTDGLSGWFRRLTGLSGVVDDR